MFGGGGGIRTLETLAGLPVFKTGALNHYATPPINDSSGISLWSWFTEVHCILNPKFWTGFSSTMFLWANWTYVEIPPPRAYRMNVNPVKRVWCSLFRTSAVKGGQIAKFRTCCWTPVGKWMLSKKPCTASQSILEIWNRFLTPKNNHLEKIYLLGLA